MSQFAPGMTLHGRYRLDQPIGVGGMAEVWRGTDLVLGRPVAIKFLDGRHEAQAAAKVTHPHIVAVHDYAELSIPDGRLVPYLVQELLTGQNLAQRLHAGPLPWPQAETVAAQIATALATAHARGIVHQDIKPANVMLTPGGVKVLDFGIATVEGAGHSPQWTVGTPAYAAPERLRQATPEPSADVFSLGVLTYEMVTGRLPWPINTWDEAVASGRPTPEPLPSEVPAVVLRAMSLEPSERPTAAEFAAALSSFRDDSIFHEIGSAPIVPPAPTLVARLDNFVPGTARVPDTPTHVYHEDSPSPMQGMSNRWVLPTLVVLLLLAVIIVLIVVLTAQSNGGGQALPPGPSGSSSPHVTASSSPVRTTSTDQARALLVSLRKAVDSGENSGQIKSNRADDFRSRIDEITRLFNGGSTGDAIGKAQDLRSRIQDRAREGDVSAAVAQNLISLLDQFMTQARR